MPIGGFVINVLPEELENVRKTLAIYPEVEIYGYDEQGRLIVVLDTRTSEEMEALVQKISRHEGVLSMDLAYLHGEDEVERIEAGEYKPKIRFARRKSDS